MQGIEQRAFRLKFRHYIHPELEYSEKNYWKAEGEGFEPPVPLGTPVFKTGVIDHSTILP